MSIILEARWVEAIYIRQLEQLQAGDLENLDKLWDKVKYHFTELGCELQGRDKIRECRTISGARVLELGMSKGQYGVTERFIQSIMEATSI